MTGYINSNTNEENPAISSFIVINSAKDGYYRKATLAHVKAQLGSFPPNAHGHDADYGIRMQSADPGGGVKVWLKI